MTTTTQIVPGTIRNVTSETQCECCANCGLAPEDSGEATLQATWVGPNGDEDGATQAICVECYEADTAAWVMDGCRRI